MDNNNTKILNSILLFDFIFYVFSNLMIFKYSPSNIYSIWALSLRDIIIFLLSIVLYIYFCNPKVGSMLLFPKINNKIVKNSIIIGIAFYLIANSCNILFTGIFKFTLKSTVYLNSIYDIYDLGIGFIFYIIISTILIEMFFRGILNDSFRFLSYKSKIILSSLIFSLFFFGFSQILYGFIIGILLMGFLNKVGSILPVIISSCTINILNYTAKLIGKNVGGENVLKFVSSSKGDVFINFIFPIIIILIGLVIYSMFEDNVRVKGIEKKISTNVVELKTNLETRNVVDVYLILFFGISLLMIFISYIFLG